MHTYAHMFIHTFNGKELGGQRVHICTCAYPHIQCMLLWGRGFTFGDRQTQETGETGNATDLLLCALDLGRLAGSLKAREPTA